ncbi:hypothetical protein QAD02_017915 [Eretmocerus hayati]|uniref:Uncharacterized protein n=1 Tax=Eretmocerus hayati TaxID=131215 RepID=A0ACC2PGF1_9HYME|nr:hypothetical protein QAD02_017915 [Eretmocerus hayati]
MAMRTAEHIETLADEKGTDYSKLFHEYHSKPWFYNLILPRDWIVMINRCRSDHYNVAASLARMNLVENAMCKCNYGLLAMNLNLPMKMSIILEKPNIPTCKLVLHFLQSCNLKI